MEDVKELLKITNEIKEKEITFHENLEKKEIENFEKIGLNPKSLLFYGEIYFLLLNLNSILSQEFLK